MQVDGGRHGQNQTRRRSNSQKAAWSERILQSFKRAMGNLGRRKKSRIETKQSRMKIRTHFNPIAGMGHNRRDPLFQSFSRESFATGNRCAVYRTSSISIGDPQSIFYLAITFSVDELMIPIHQHNNICHSLVTHVGN